MKIAYKFGPAQLIPAAEEEASILVYHQPSDAEKEELLQRFDIDPFDLEAVFDPDEVSRIENSPDGTFMIWKRPDNVSNGASMIQFEVSSIGISIRRDKVVFIVPRGDLPLSGRDFKDIRSVWDCVLHIFLHSAHHYQGHLKAIKMMSQQLQTKIEASMENRYLLQMFALGESLVYYYNALESNLIVLTKIRNTPDRLKITAEQVDFLDDVIIENQQASKQAGIYSTVLSGLMDARGTIVNNNMNVLLKNLTIINVVFLPLNLIASIFGMSEYSALTHKLDWREAYGLFALAMILLGWLTWWWLVKVIDRSQNRSRKIRN